MREAKGNCPDRPRIPQNYSPSELSEVNPTTHLREVTKKEENKGMGEDIEEGFKEEEAEESPTKPHPKKRKASTSNIRLS